jgi:hypothetical protein
MDVMEHKLLHPNERTSVLQPSRSSRCNGFAFRTLQILSTHHITPNNTRQHMADPCLTPHSTLHGIYKPKLLARTDRQHTELHARHTIRPARIVVRPNETNKQTDYPRRSCKVSLEGILFVANSDEDRQKRQQNKQASKKKKCGLFEINVQKNGSSATRENSTFALQCRIKRCRASRRCLCAIQRNWAGRTLACLRAWPSLQSLLSRLGSRRRKRGN